MKVYGSLAYGRKLPQVLHSIIVKVRTGGEVHVYHEIPDTEDILGNVPHVYYMCDTYVIYMWGFGVLDM